jgi:hypothetical protein
MKNKINFLAVVIMFSFMLFAMVPAGAESINTLQQNLNSSRITTEGGGAAEVGNASNAVATAVQTTAAGARQSLAESCNQLKSSCKNFFNEVKPIFKSFFQSLFSLFKQFIQQVAEAFKGCTGSLSNTANNFTDQSSSGNDVVNNSANKQAADDNNSSDNSGSDPVLPQAPDNSNSAVNKGVGDTKAPPVNNNQGAAPERPAGRDSAVDTNDAMSLVRALKDKFNITVETGTAQWSLSQLQQTYQTLSKLPPSFIAQTNMLRRISTTNLGASVGGYVSSNAPRVYITDHGTRTMTFVLVHEMAHCFHFAKPAIFNQWQSQFWGGRNGYSGTGTQVSRSVSSYGNSNSMEDFAESVRAYYMSGPSMKRSHPDRYEFIKNNVMAGVEY